MSDITCYIAPPAEPGWLRTDKKEMVQQPAAKTVATTPEESGFKHFHMSTTALYGYSTAAMINTATVFLTITPPVECPFVKAEPERTRTRLSKPEDSITIRIWSMREREAAKLGQKH